MKTLIVYTHPWDGSFNHHVFEETKRLITEKGNEVDVIDLHSDGFKPDFTPEDLRVFGKGEYADAQAEDYVNRLKEADEVIFIHPIWWYGAPAMLKGFFDKVFLKGQTYVQDENHNIKGILGIKKSAVFTTGNINKEFFSALGDPIERTMIQGIFGMVGIENTTWIHCPTVHMEESRENFIKEINEYLV
ncbi:MAG: NAD(P)H-dependent oxidoreductase [Erysipelothrix sp.]